MRRSRLRVVGVLGGLLAMAAVACSSPEARRRRDGGPGADVGNTDLTRAASANPHAADTTLWPGRNPAPVERLARGEIPPPAGVSAASAPQRRGNGPVTPDVPGSKAEQSTFDKGKAANPRAAAPPSPRTPPP